MGWLMKEKIYVEENNLDTIIPTNVGVLFYVHPRASLNDTHQQQLISYLKGPEVPAFKIKSWKAKSQEYEGRVYLIQAAKGDAETVHKKFENARKWNPYKYVSWKSWTDLNPDKKATLIDDHNKFQKDYRLLTLSGFIDNNNVPLGIIDREPEEADYSNLQLNAFIMKHYTIGTPPCQIISQAMGPFQGTRLFIVPAALDKVAKDLLQSLHYDMLSYMTEESGRLIIPNYDEKVEEAAENPVWEPNWFEEHIAPMAKPTPMENGRAVKRQKSDTMDQESRITHKPSQPMTKSMGTMDKPPYVQAAGTESEKIARLQKQIETLQTQQMDLLSYITEVKQTQHVNQTKINTMSNKIEVIEQHNQVALKEIRECKVNMTKVESVLSSLTTKEETETAFNKILSMFGDVSEALRQLSEGAVNQSHQNKVDFMVEVHENQHNHAINNPYQEANQDQNRFLTGGGDHTNNQNNTAMVEMNLK
jgi:hypothetical protein